jgi:hypothetical protein
MHSIKFAGNLLYICECLYHHSLLSLADMRVKNCVEVGISVPKVVLEQIDRDRGDINRSRYLLRLIEDKYGSKLQSGGTDTAKQ